jgi:predicted nucleic acid-binding protein
MYLLDTNIWLERLLEQERAEEVGQLLERLPSDELLITDFSFHSIGVICSRLGEQDAFLNFVQDLFLDGEVILFSLRPEDMHRLVEVMNDFNLDFDDAYQYVAAEVYEAILVSFDGDFDSTERGRSTPAELLEVGEHEDLPPLQNSDSAQTQD